MSLNQASLLIVRCPFKPFADMNSGLLHQDPSSIKSQEFTWYLSDGLGLKGVSGVGSIESLPYADQVLVLMPTLDVRLIEVKMPLVSNKKLQAILPGLMEEYFLQGSDRVQLQLLPPIPGAPALQRTVAVIDRTWLSWVSKQLMDLLSPRVQLVPDCYLLKPIQLSGNPSPTSSFSQPSIAYELIEQDLVWTVRSNELIGAAWAERASENNLSAERMIANLPAKLRLEKIAPFDWAWLVEAAYQFIGQSMYAALNLLPDSFRSRSTGAARRINLPRSMGSGVWADRGIWHSSIQAFHYCFAAILIGMSVHLSWLALTDWRWSQQMQLWAIPHLSAGSATALVGSSNDQSVLSAIAREAIQDQRMRGLVSHADFSQMASELQRLNLFYGGAMIESLEYDGYSLALELKPGALILNKVSPAELVTKANSLGFAVIALGDNQFRLLSYAGLGSNL